MFPLLLFLAAAFLAYANGANDNFKGVASLYGSGAASYRGALGWATLTTLAGSIAAIFLAPALLKKFSGKGLVPEALAVSEHFLLAVVVGAALTVIVATLAGFPVSTTHGLTGALTGAGLLALRGGVNFAALQRTFLLPLLLSPVLAVVLAAAVYLLWRFIRVKVGLAQERDAGSLIGSRARGMVDAAHFASAGVVCFARALNDTPKIVAMLLVLKALDLRWGFVATAVAMAVGGLIHSRRIAETMSRKITTMSHGQGLAANLCTGLLVILASVCGLPVSTTHVAVGALFGIGLTTGRADPKVMTGIVLSWVLTLPCAAALGAAMYWVLGPG